MFLSRDELEQLTGYNRPGLQRRWLVDNDYRFDVRADGRAAVLKEQVHQRQSKGEMGARVPGPNLGVCKNF